MQHFLKPASRATGTEIVSSEPFEQFLVAAADAAVAAFDPSLAQGTPGDALTSAQNE